MIMIISIHMDAGWSESRKMPSALRPLVGSRGFMILKLLAGLMPYSFVGEVLHLSRGLAHPLPAGCPTTLMPVN